MVRAGSALLLILAGCEFIANIPDYGTGAGSADGGNSGTDGSSGSDAPPAECELATECAGLEVCVAGQCQLCDRDAHCGDAATSACLPDGTCAGPDRMAFAAPSGGGTACSQAAPCTIEQAFVNARESSTIDIVKLAPGTYARGSQIAVGTDTVIVAGEGATLMGAQNVQMLHVTDGSLTVVGLTLVGDAQFNALCYANAVMGTLVFHRVTSRAGGYGIGGFGCAVTVNRSLIQQNTAIGAYLQASRVRMSNSVVMGNGIGGGAAGGLQLVNVTDARIELSTFVGNTSAAPENAAGITCGGSTQTITSSVVWGNTGSTLLDAACTVSYSVVETTYAGGVSNVRSDPQFVAAGDFHVQATSPARGAADPAIATNVDYDNEPRPQGALDSGADELP